MHVTSYIHGIEKYRLYTLTINIEWKSVNLRFTNISYLEIKHVSCTVHPCLVNFLNFYVKSFDEKSKEISKTRVAEAEIATFEATELEPS